MGNIQGVCIIVLKFLNADGQKTTVRRYGIMNRPEKSDQPIYFRTILTLNMKSKTYLSSENQKCFRVLFP